MNQEKVGKLIAKCRKEKKLTQEQLASILGVTDRAVSHWENGRCIPDVSLFIPLCETLDISVNELIIGEVIESKNFKSKSDEIIVTVLKKEKKKKKIYDIVLVTLIIFVIVLTILLGLVNRDEFIKGTEELNELHKVKMEIVDNTLTKSSAKIIIHDFSGKQYIYGSSYTIEKKINGVWTELESNNRMINVSKAYYPDVNGVLEFVLNWGYVYGELDTGIYRIVKYAINKNEKCNSTCRQYYFSVEFAI